MRHGHRLATQVDPFDLPDHQVAVRDETPQRRHHVAEVQFAGGHLVEHGSEEGEVVTVDHRDLQVVLLPRFLQPFGYRQAREAGAQDDDSHAPLNEGPGKRFPG